MEVTTTYLPDENLTQVDVVIDAETVKKHITAHYKKLAKNRIPGFRPGRAPRPVIDQNFGGHDNIFADITTDMVNEIAPRAVDGEGIMFISQPDFGKLDNVVEGEDYTFTIKGTLKPSMELLTYDPVEVKMPSKVASDEEIDFQVNSLRSYYYTFETVEDRPVEGEDFVSMDLNCTIDGDGVQGLTGEDRLVELSAGTLPEALVAEIIGMNTGDSKEFDFSIEGEEDYDYLDVDTLHAEVTVKEIRTKVVPELDEDFAQKLGMEDMDGVRKMIADALNKQKESSYPNVLERRCVEALAERLFGEPSAAYKAYCRQDVLRDFYNNLQQQGITMDAFLAQEGITREDFSEDVEKEAAEVAAQGLALDALFAHMDELTVTEDDVTEEFSVVDDPAAVRKQWEEAGRMSEIREGIARRKATEWLVETAVVSEDTGEAEDED